MVRSALELLTFFFFVFTLPFAFFLAPFTFFFFLRGFSEALREVFFFPEIRFFFLLTDSLNGANFVGELVQLSPITRTPDVISLAFSNETA